MYAERANIDITSDTPSQSSTDAGRDAVLALTHDDDKHVSDPRVPLTRMLTLRGLLSYGFVLFCFWFAFH